MKTFGEVMVALREQAQQVKRHYGAAFEETVRQLLLRAPLYRQAFKAVHLWSDLHAGGDTGIDLVAESETGELYGIQVKCYEADHAISKPEVDSFLARLGGTVDYLGETRPFAGGFLFASTDLLNANARETLAKQTRPVQFIGRSTLEAMEGLDWEVLAGLSQGPVVPEKPLRDYQREALAAAQTHYAAGHTRGKLIMACGTGKTLTALRLLEQELPQGGLALFLVPSIALLNQTLVAWSDDAARPLHAICVCSDNTANRRKRSAEDTFSENPNALALPPSTSPEEVARRIRAHRAAAPGELTVVFSTYQSIEVLEAAQALLGREAFPFDFVICDEAHRTTGAFGAQDERSAFTRVHDDALLLARRRLYMTATPRIYGEGSRARAAEEAITLCSMDDPAIYGEEIYCISFSQAVAKGCLSDYKVFVLTLPAHAFPGAEALYQELSEQDRKALDKDQDGPSMAIKLLGTLNALAKRLVDSPLLDAQDRLPARRAVAFCRTIATSRATAALFARIAARSRQSTVDSRQDACRDSLTGEPEGQPPPFIVEARHVDGTMDAGERNTLLAWLKEGPAHTPPAPALSTVDCSLSTPAARSAAARLLTNVRCLSEGVDVPTLDAAIFLSKRNSEIDVVQSVGRVMRRAKGKRYGYVIIPVVIPADKKPEEVLDDREAFGVVWSVLNALRSHDDRFEARINQLKFRQGHNEEVPGEPAPAAEEPILLSSGLGPGDGTGVALRQGELDLRLPDQMEHYRQLLFARVVEKCGSRLYFIQWAEDVAKIATRLVETLRERVATVPAARDAFNRYFNFLQTAVYATVDEETAYTLLAQQRITGPVFDALFGGNAFTAHNPVSEAIDHATRLLENLERDEDRRKLAQFYKLVRLRVEGITTEDGRLDIIRTLYDTFFARAFPAMASKLGIVFTPIEVVDFILRSADGALRKYFGQCLSDEGVHILDPFTGTGTFIARLLQRDLGLIRRDDLLRKYTRELHANEIVLLSYYIAAVNIENIFHARQGRKETYTAFPGIVFGDTFRMQSVTTQDTLDDGAFTENSERLLAQNKAPISVILGNPPYSVAKGDSYPALDQRIEETYAAGSSATNKNSLYDSYIKAFRWSTDRLSPQRGGVVAYVSNGGWLDSNACDAFRKCLQAEFDHIYVYNLRGNQNTQGEVSRREGGKIFDSGCRCPITILLLVRLPEGQHRGNAEILYRDIGDYKSREEKLHTLDLEASFFNPTWEGTPLTPNAHGDWINQRNEAFAKLLPIAPNKKFDPTAKAFFFVNSRGVESARDPWLYNFDLPSVIASVRGSIEMYQASLQVGKALETPAISWNRSLRTRLAKGEQTSLDASCVRKVLYRPFCKQYHYFSSFWNNYLYQQPQFFPTGAKGENLVICVSGGSCLITDCTPDLHFVGDAQCFPLHWYSEAAQGDLFGGGLVRHDGVSDWIQREAEAKYGHAVPKEALFYYVYGYLHKTDWREAFAADLKKELPRIPLVARAADFEEIARIGRELADLHLHYEALEPYPLEEVGSFSNPRIEKMTFPGKDKTQVKVNDTLTLRGIPPEAHDYVVNGRSPVEWVLDRYQVKRDKASGLLSDPNLWAPENPRYIPELIKRLVTLSLRSRELMRALRADDRGQMTDDR